MFTGDKAAEMVGSIAEVFPGAAHRHCTVHFYRNVLAKLPKSKRPKVAAMLKAVHAMESHEASVAKALAVATELESMPADMLHKDALEETSCEKLRAGMGVKEPQWLSQAILSSHIRKPVLCVGWIVQTSSEQAVRSSDVLGVHGTGWDVHETFWASMGRVGRPSDVLQMSIWHHDVLVALL